MESEGDNGRCLPFFQSGGAPKGFSMTTTWEGGGWCPHLSGITTITSPSHPAGQIRKSEPVPGKGRVQLQSHSARAPQTELGRIELIFILQGW